MPNGRGEHHGDAMGVGGLDDFVVAHRAARLDHSGGAGLDGNQQTVREREKRRRKRPPIPWSPAPRGRPPAQHPQPCARRCAPSRRGSSVRRRYRPSRNGSHRRSYSTSHASPPGRQTLGRAIPCCSAPSSSQVSTPSHRRRRCHGIAPRSNALLTNDNVQCTLYRLYSTYCTICY